MNIFRPTLHKPLSYPYSEVNMNKQSWSIGFETESKLSHFKLQKCDWVFTLNSQNGKGYYDQERTWLTMVD